jgi:hypothetical protein
MIKLNASYSKKVPADQDYSSKSYLACVEVELPTGATPQELQQKIHETFKLVEESVEAEINGQTTHNQGQHNRDQHRGSQGSSQEQKPYIPASNKQVKYILDLGKAKSMLLADLNAEAGRLYGVDSIYNLSKPDASRFVDHLKQAA